MPIRGVEGELALEGNLFLGDYNFTMGTSSTVTGTPSNTAMVVAEGNGELRKMFDANGSFTFPVGDTTDINEFTPLSLDFTAGTYAPDLMPQLIYQTLNMLIIQVQTTLLIVFGLCLKQE